MSKRRRYNARANAIILIAIILSYFLHFTGVSWPVIIQLVSALLLLWALFYVLYIPIISIWNQVADIFDWLRIRKVIRANPNIDNLNWSEFEHYVADRLKRQGYVDVRLTEHYDLGIDVIAKKGGVVWGVQVKHYNSKQVGVDAVRQVITALKRYKCDRAMVVTNNFFTEPAQILANSNSCVLVDRKLITKWD